RKVSGGGGDTRTYKVSFEKITKALPGFKCEWSVEKGVIDLAAKLQELHLDLATFKSRGFYRLQQLEYLYENGFISDDLYWLKGKPE
ncbi:MAG: NAD-dependent epimerase/dehydratase, partial [Segetibacter sp.]|nr:NAD-dependent epimerase/dehydratase [Segetibacter sp.]